jgi:hypothetical protein
MTTDDKRPGPDWWLASDGRWYPPESHPAAVPSPPRQDEKSGAASFGEALSSLGCLLTILGFGVLALVVVVALVI